MKRRLLFFLFFFQVTTYTQWYDEIEYSTDISLELKAKPEEVLLRFYLLKRLERPVDFFKACLSKSVLKISFDYQEQHNHIIMSGVHFKQKDVIAAIKGMQEQNSFEPLLEVWNILSTYKLVDDPLIVKEFSILIASILHSNALNSGFELHEPLKHMKLPGGLTSLPLEDVLDILDLLIDELPEYFDKYEFDSDMTWKLWRRKYGILSVIGGLALLIRVYLTYKKHHPEESILNLPLVN